MSDLSGLDLCPLCGAANPRGAKSCARCGVALGEALAKAEAARLAMIDEEKRHIEEVARGTVTVQGESFSAKSAMCELIGERLFAEAHGDGCDVCLVGMPFPGVDGYAELSGKAWEGGDDGAADEADVLCEGGVWIRGERLEIRHIRVTCGAYDARKRALPIEIEMSGADSGGRDVAGKASLVCADLARE